MTDKELVDSIEAIKDETYRITKREVNKITSEFKMKLKAIQDERTNRGEVRSINVNYGCSDCVVSEINLNFLPYLESERYEALKNSVEPTEVIQVELKMVPDVIVEEEIKEVVEPVKIDKRKKK